MSLIRGVGGQDQRNGLPGEAGTRYNGGRNPHNESMGHRSMTRLEQFEGSANHRDIISMEQVIIKLNSSRGLGHGTSQRVTHTDSTQDSKSFPKEKSWTVRLSIHRYIHLTWSGARPARTQNNKRTSRTPMTASLPTPRTRRTKENGNGQTIPKNALKHTPVLLKTCNAHGPRTRQRVEITGTENDANSRPTHGPELVIP